MTQLYFKKQMWIRFLTVVLEYTPGTWFNKLSECPVLNLVVKFTKISKFACASRSTYSWVLQYINVIDRRNAHYAEVLNLVWYPDRILLSLVRSYLACRERYTYSSGILRKLQCITVPMGNVKKWTLELRWNCDNAGGSTWAPPSSTVWPCQHQ